ncbi:MAG: hypothetical protein ABFS16_07225, partial [Bacteroidota bacterium]
MKLKTFFWIGLLLIPFIACEEIDAPTSKIGSELNVNIPLTAIDLKSAQHESTYSFSGTSTFSLKDCNEFKNCMFKIKEIISETGHVLTFQEINQGNEIETLQLLWGYKSQSGIVYNMQAPIDISSENGQLNDNEIDFDLSSSVAPLIQNMNNDPACCFILTVSGTSNFDITSTARLK